MENLAQAKQHIDSFYRPNGYNLQNWRILKKTALIIWEYYLTGGSWNCTIKVPCKELYFMLLNSDKELIIKKKLLVWKQNKFNKNVREVYLNRGIELFEQGQYSHALKCLNLVALIEPVSYKVHFYRAMIHRIQNNHSEATTEFAQAQKVAPDYFLTYLKRAEMYIDLGMYNKAQADLDEAIHLNPKNNYLTQLYTQVQKTVTQAA